MFVRRWPWLPALVVASNALLASWNGTVQDPPPDWTLVNFPRTTEGFQAAKGEGFCSTVEGARAYARSTARSSLVWAITNDPNKWSEPNGVRDDQIVKTLDPLFQDTRDYMVTERDGVFHGYALVRVNTDRAKAAITGVPGSVRRPGASWIGKATYTPSAQQTLEIRGPSSDAGAFTFHLVAEPGGTTEMHWYFDRIVIDLAGGVDARWAFDISINGARIHSIPRIGFDSVRPSTCWPGTFGQMMDANGDWRPTYRGASMGTTPKATSYVVQIEGFRLDYQ